jgi:hypothetical protein
MQVPPTGKGSLYIRPLLVGSGAVLGLAPAPEYTFIIFASPVGNYFKVCIKRLSLIIHYFHEIFLPQAHNKKSLDGLVYIVLISTLHDIIFWTENYVPTIVSTISCGTVLVDALFDE